MIQESISSVSQRVEPERGQVYEGGRSEELYQLLYVDEQIVLLRCEDTGRHGQHNHRIELRSDFDKNLKHGHFSYHPESNLDLISTQKIDWSQVSYIGAKTTENLYDSGIVTTVDVQQATDDELLSIEGVGSAGLNNLREFI